MHYFNYQANELYAENVKLKDIAEEFGTPCYVYSRATLEENWRAFDAAFRDTPHQICYAVKANSNVAVLNLLAKLGSGFDIVSGGELQRVLHAGGRPKKIVFSGVGKTDVEIIDALEADIGCFNVESEAELERIQILAKKQDKIANVALRVNPDIDAKTHPYIATGLKENKFGIDIQDIPKLSQLIASYSHVRLSGLACHIGSQLTELTPFIEALDMILKLSDTLTEQGFVLEHVNIGGGLGIRYHHEIPPSIDDYVSSLCEQIKKRPYKIFIEPGRAITANAGVLVTRVEYLKHSAHKNFAVVDAAMNDFMRPALYDAWQDILPVSSASAASVKHYDIVGPICESGDFLAKNRELALQQGDLIAICATGAYGFSMSSNYNSRPRVAEVMVDKDRVGLIRKRESIHDLFSHETLFKE